MTIEFDKSKVEFCESNNRNDEFKSVLNESNNIDKKENKNEDVGVLKKLVITMRARRSIKGSAIVGIVVTIAPQLQWVVINYS